VLPSQIERLIVQDAPNAASAQAIIEFLDSASRDIRLTLWVDPALTTAPPVEIRFDGEEIAALQPGTAHLVLHHPSPLRIVAAYGSHVVADGDRVAIDVNDPVDVRDALALLRECVTTRARAASGDIEDGGAQQVEDAEGVGVGEEIKEVQRVQPTLVDEGVVADDEHDARGRGQMMVAAQMPEIPLRAESLRVGQVLGLGAFKVPDFQRPYAWKDDNIKDLWDDVLDFARPDATFPHFFGTLLTAPAPEGAWGTLDVLDGQQRLTTFTLLLVALDRQLEELEDPDAARHVREGAAECRSRISQVLFAAPGRRRLTLRAADDHLLGALIAGNPAPGTTIGQAFSKLNEHLRQHLDEHDDKFGELDRLTRAVLDGSVVIHANCLAGFDSFVVFTTLNTTGLELTATQILRAKSLGLTRAFPAPIPDSTRAAWDTVEALGDDGGDAFLRDVLTMRSGNRVQSKDVVRLFDREVLKSRALGEVPDRNQHFLDIAGEIQRLAPTHTAVRQGAWPPVSPVVDDWHSNRIRVLVRDLGVRQVVPLLVAAADRVGDQFADVLDVVERACFVALTCLDNQTRWGDTLFKLSEDVYSQGAGVERITSVMQEFLARQLIDPVATLRRRLPEQLRYNVGKQAHIRYFLTTVNDWGYPDSPIPMNLPDTQSVWNLRNIHLDHIAPQNGPGEIPGEDLDRLGNLTPLRNVDNQGLGNNPFEMKQPVYRGSPFRITRDLSTKPAWNLEALEEREVSIVAFAVAFLSRDLVSLQELPELEEPID
jgi:hypothetical protein